MLTDLYENFGVLYVEISLELRTSQYSCTNISPKFGEVGGGVIFAIFLNPNITKANKDKKKET